MSTISQFPQEQAREAVGLAIDQIEGRPPREIVVQPQLVVRETTARVVAAVSGSV